MFIKRRKPPFESIPPSKSLHDPGKRLHHPPDEAKRNTDSASRSSKSNMNRTITTGVSPSRAGYAFLFLVWAGCFLSAFSPQTLHAQDTGVLKLSEAVIEGLRNYQSIQAKRQYLE